MNITQDARARIEDRIKRLARPRSPAVARDELRQHVLDAAADAAGGKDVKAQHIDEAFAGLGSDDEIRATFFPAKTRVPVGRLQVGLLAVAFALAATAILSDDGGTASCSVEGPGSCEASASGDALELAVWSLPALAVLAVLHLAPAWAAALIAVAYFLVATVRTIDVATIGGVSAGAWLLPIAALLALGVAGNHAMLEWRTGRAVAAGPV